MTSRNQEKNFIYKEKDMKLKLIELLDMKYNDYLKENFKFVFKDSVYTLINQQIKNKNGNSLGNNYIIENELDQEAIVLTPELIDINIDTDSENKRSVTKEDVDNILANTFIKTEKYGDKTTIVKATLPNGFVIIADSSCVEPNNFDMSIGEQECMKKIEAKIWELEGYRLQCEISEK